MSYQRSTWVRGDTITSARLNNIEEGIVNTDGGVATLAAGQSALNTAIGNLQTADTQMQGAIDALDSAVSELEAGSLPALNAEAGDVPTADGNGAWGWGSGLRHVEQAMISYPHSTNWLNMQDVEEDRSIDATGAVVPFTPSSAGQNPRNTTGWIPARTGDTVYYNGIKANGDLLRAASATDGGQGVATGATMVSLAWYDANKNFLDLETNCNGFELPQESSPIAWIRVTYQRSQTVIGCQELAIMFSKAQTVNDIEPFYEQGYEVADRYLRKSTAVVRPDRFIAGWGDSRIANGGTTTSVIAYLAQLMGINNMSNYGISGQGSGEVALRMDAVECFVRLANNQIVSGDNAATFCRINRGSVPKNFVQYSASASGGVPCSIYGITGKLWQHLGDGVKFTPDNPIETPVSITPLVKVFVSPPLHYRYTIIWAGKNDFYNYADAGFSAYLADMVCAMAEKLPHNRFIILGETTSLLDIYQTGGAARTVMDAYNATMAARYPDNFIDIQAELMKPVEDQTYKIRGLELAGVAFGHDGEITPVHHSMTDAEALSAGLLVPSLLSIVDRGESADPRYEADNVHQNKECRQAIAKIIYERMQALGWV